MLRCIDCVLAPIKAQVLETQARLYGKLDNLDPQLRHASGYAFYNTSRYDFERLCDDAPHLADNLRNYIAGFSDNMREVIDKFDFDNTITKLDDAGSGESEIRRYVLEHDLLDALIALPEHLFYNTGIATYIWVLSNRKPAERKGLVQMIDATDLWAPMRKSLGDKRREISQAQAQDILALYDRPADGERTKLFPTTHFGYRKITVERPLRLNFQASPERLARLEEERSFQNLAKTRKKKPEVKAQEEVTGRTQNTEIRAWNGLARFRNSGVLIQLSGISRLNSARCLTAPLKRQTAL